MGMVFRGAPNPAQLEILWPQPCALRDAGEHTRAELFIVVEGEHHVVPPGSLQRAMRSRLPLNPPADAH